MITMEEMRTLAWEVWGVYKGWGLWVYHKYRPWRPYLTWSNVGMGLVTFIAIVVGFVVLIQKHQKRKRLEEERERRLSFTADDLFIRKQHLRRVKKREKMEKDEVRIPANCPFKDLFGGLLAQGEGGGGGGGGTDNGDGDNILGKLREEIHRNIKQKNESGGGDAARMVEDDNDDDLPSLDSEEEIMDTDRPYLTKDGRDPLEIAMHIPAELKKIQNKIQTREMEKQLTEDQRKDEAKARREQLEQIFKLMNEQKDKFGEQNNEDIEEQMRMYSL